MAVSLVNEFTVVTPSPATKVVYVSSSAGNDANSGTQAAPVKTISHARGMIPAGVSGHILLKCGDTWSEVVGTWDGVSADDPSMLSYYGTGARPVLKTGTGDGLDAFGSAIRSNFAVIGIRFYANGRDPSIAGFSSQDASAINWLMQSNNIIIEDCEAQFYKDGMVIQGYDGPIKGVTFRWNKLLDSWSTTARSQGLYLANCDAVLGENNFFDRNGWNTAAGAPKTPENHNGYFQWSDGGNVTFNKNISMNGSSHGFQMRSGGIADDNFFALNAISLLMCTDDPEDPNVGKHTGEANRNVVYAGNDIDAADPRAWGIDINPSQNLECDGNYIVAAIGASPDHAIAVYSGAVGANVHDNVVANWGQNAITNQGTGTIGLSTNKVLKFDGRTIAQYCASHPPIWPYTPDTNPEPHVGQLPAIMRARPLRTSDPNYTAAALNAYIRAGFSVVTVPPPTPPNAPSGLQAPAAAVDQINCVWVDQSNNETGFVLDRATDSAFTQNLVSTTYLSNVQGASATGLKSSTTYFFRVKAVNAAGSSAYSNVASASTTAASAKSTVAFSYDSGTQHITNAYQAPQGASTKIPLTTAQLKALVAAANMLLLCLMLMGCPKPQTPQTNSLPAGTSAIGRASGGIEGATTQAGAAQREVRAAIPATTAPARGHLLTADEALTVTLTDLASAKTGAADAAAAIAAATAEHDQMAKALGQAESDAEKATAGVKYWQHKYESQWFAGRFWATFWTVSIGLGVLVLIMLWANAKTAIFEVVWSVIETPVKAICSFIAGAFIGLLAMLKPKPPVPPVAP